MQVVTPKPLFEFAARHPRARGPLRTWLHVMSTTDFPSPHQLKLRFPAASLLGAGLTVFNIGGNKYRLVVTVRDELRSVFIRHVLTHREYDRRSARGDL